MPKLTANLPDPEPLLISDLDAAALCGVSRATWHRLRASGRIPPGVKLSRCLRWNRAEILAWVEAGCPDQRIWSAMKGQQRRRA
jgi:predicted DNA-binding transcriptional regulator AlpA